MVAVGSGLRTVPNVVGQGIAQASALIKGAGLAPVLNPIPSTVNPTTAKISLQVPDRAVEGEGRLGGDDLRQPAEGAADHDGRDHDDTDSRRRGRARRAERLPPRQRR